VPHVGTLRPLKNDTGPTRLTPIPVLERLVFFSRNPVAESHMPYAVCQLLMTGRGVHCTCGHISPYSGRECVKLLRSSYTGLYPQSYCAPCRPLFRAFHGWTRSPPPTNSPPTSIKASNDRCRCFGEAKIAYLLSYHCAKRQCELTGDPSQTERTFNPPKS